MKMFYSMLFSLLMMPLLAMAADTLPDSATFEDVDMDNSGDISKAEALRRSDLAKYWKDIDSNQDDKINVEEFTAYESRGRFMPPEDSQAPELGAAPMD